MFQAPSSLLAQGHQEWPQAEHPTYGGTHMKGLWFSVWAASCISIGVLVGYVDGMNSRAIIAGAMFGSTLVIGALASTIVMKMWKRKWSARSRDPHQSQRLQDTEEEAMNAADFRLAAVTIGGAGIGFVIGSMLFTEFYAMVASAIVGGVASPIIAMWHQRHVQRLRERE